MLVINNNKKKDDNIILGDDWHTAREPVQC